MTGWLSVTEKLWGRRAARSPDLYTLECACGRQLSGARCATEQVTYCAACGSPWLILPQSVYPRLHGLQEEPAPAVAPAFATVPEPVALHPLPQRVNPQPDPVVPQARQVRRPLPPAVRVTEPETARRVPESRVRRRLLTPVRMVLLGVCGVIALTVWWTLRSGVRTKAELTLTTAVREAQAALEEHDLGQAARRYQDIRNALDLLGRRDAQARALRQTAAEIIAAAALSRSSLVDILREAVETTTRSGEEGWNETFRTSYQDEWIVVDALVARHPTDAGTGQWEIDCPIVYGVERAVLVGDLKCFQQAVPGDSPRRVIFAAQLAGFRRSSTLGDYAWQVVLRPTTAILWSSSENLERVGLDVDPDTARVLEEQQRLLESYQ